jgi:hypothetical protein
MPVYSLNINESGINIWVELGTTYKNYTNIENIMFGNIGQSTIRRALGVSIPLNLTA